VKFVDVNKDKRKKTKGIRNDGSAMVGDKSKSATENVIFHYILTHCLRYFCLFSFFLFLFSFVFFSVKTRIYPPPVEPTGENLKEF